MVDFLSLLILKKDETLLASSFLYCERCYITPSFAYLPNTCFAVALLGSSVSTLFQ